MKPLFLFKLLLFTVFSIALSSCGDDDNPATCSIVANVSFNGASASPSIVNLYPYDSAKEFDRSYEAMCQFGDSRILLDMKGREIPPAYTSPTTIGVNTFEDVKSGKYIAVCLYKPNGFTFPMYYYYGYCVVDATGSLASVFFKFSNSSERGKFIEFK